MRIIERVITLMIEKNSEDQKTTTARRIKMARTLAGISRKDLEDKYGISTHTLQSWELGRNSLSEKAASKLVEIFHSAGVGCSSEWLLKGSGRSPTILASQFTPYPAIDKDIAPLLGTENSIQKEIDFFKLNNPNATVIMVSDDTMEPRYSRGDFVGGIQYMNTLNIEDCIGHDCIIEISDGIFFRRLMKRKNGYALVCLNAQTEIEDPIIFSKIILAVTPIIWHRWKFKKPDREII
jgi:DNA-binding transcriptional regulator YiaG